MSGRKASENRRSYYSTKCNNRGDKGNNKKKILYQHQVAEYEITEFLPTKFNADLKAVLDAL